MIKTRGLENLTNMDFKLRVWHCPQVTSGDIFYVYISDIQEAWGVLNVLLDYDLFQLHHSIKPGYCNMNGLEIWEETEECWVKWRNEDGMGIREYYDWLKEEKESENYDNH